MIATARGEVKKKGLEIMIGTFKEFFPIMVREGHLPESEYNELGYPPGFEEGDEGIDRSVGIECGHIQ
eukprot:3837675-Ditylum_brightwellii.AAC.1